MGDAMTRLARLLRLTVQDPRGAAREVLALPLDLANRWQALALTVVLSALLAQLTQLLLPPEAASAMRAMFGTPLQTGMLQGGLLVMIATALHLVGRAMGGVGSFADALLLVAWLQVVLIALQLVQMLAILLVPQLAGLIGILGIALFFWLLTHFAIVLHGFRSMVKVFVVIVIALFGLAFASAVVMAMLGFGVPQGV